MPRFSAFTPYGLLRHSSKPSTAEAIYHSMAGGLSAAFDLGAGTNTRAEVYATAMGLARARSIMERAKNQHDPDRAQDMLASHEAEFSVVPVAGAGMRSRQRAVAARRRVSHGARRENVEAVLRAILGDAFLYYRTITVDEKETWPADPSLGPGVFSRPDLPTRLFRLVSSITTLGAPVTFTYERFDGDDGVRLLKDDVVCMQGEHTSRAEKVSITAVSGLTATATFTKPKDAGSTIATGPFPLWMSTKRHSFIVVTDAAAADHALRRRVNDEMARLARFVSTWSIVKRTTATTIGPFTVGESPLGEVPLGEFPIP